MISHFLRQIAGHVAGYYVVPRRRIHVNVVIASAHPDDYAAIG